MKKLILAVLLAFAVLDGAVAVSAVTGSAAVAEPGGNSP
jgi:F0F1-type ATP synthase assembly protein I